MTNFFELPDFSDSAAVTTDTAAGFASGMHVAIDPECCSFDVTPGRPLELLVREETRAADWAEMGMILTGEGWASCNRFLIRMVADSQQGCEFRVELKFERADGVATCALPDRWQVQGAQTVLSAELTPDPGLRADSGLVRLVLHFQPTVFDLRIHDLTVAGFH